MNNLHISFTNLKNESRLLKETDTLVKNKIFIKIYIVGLHSNGLSLIEDIDKQRVINRINLKTRSLSKFFIFQLIKYMEFLITILFKYNKNKIKVVNIHSLGLLPIGVLYKLIYKTKLVYDAHEYETEVQGLTRSRKKLYKIIEKLLIKYCDRVIVVSESIANEYKKLYPKLAYPFIVLNTPKFQEIEQKDIFRNVLNISKNKIIFLYQGGLSKGRGIEILLDTFKNISDDRVVIVFMGYGTLQQLVQEVSKKNKNIYYHKAVSPNILLDYTSSADFGISMIEDSCLSYKYCLPNKMFEYLMAEIPVIVSNLYEMKKLVEKCQVGIVAEKNTVEGLHEAIDKALKSDKKMLSRNIQRMKKIYNWEEQEKVLLQVYRELI